MINYYCCIFDRNYSVKGLAMLNSLKHFQPKAQIFVLTLDEFTEQLLKKLSIDGITLIPLSDVENTEVLEAKSNRNLVEYYWTLSSVFTHYVFSKIKNNFGSLTYLDSDIFFYSNPQRIFEQLKSTSSCIITPHNFSRRLADRIVNGKFCVQWVTFVNNDEGGKILSEWRKDCLQWCYYRLEDGKMGDQKYLDYWDSTYEGVIIDGNIGAGLAPWNYEDKEIKRINGNIMVDNEPLIFYHFHQFTHTGIETFDRISKFYSDVAAVPEEVYSTYEARNNEYYQLISSLMNEVPYTFNASKTLKLIIRRFVQNHVPHSIKNIIRPYLLR